MSWAAVTSGSLTFEGYKDKFRPVTYGSVELTTEVIDDMFSQFVDTFKQGNFVNKEYKYRRDIFEQNLRKIVSHNLDSTQSWKMGINEYTDMTDEEFNEYFHLNVKAPQNCSATASPLQAYPERHPQRFDWREHGAVTPVKNQGKCGSCWTFSTVGAMESHFFLKHRRHGNFSEQQLVDCAGKYDCHGCSGGLPSYAFNYIRDNGMTCEHKYPYHAKDETCYYNKTMAKVMTSGPFNITAYNETQLEESIYWKGPVSVAFQVVGDFRNYESGVYNSTTCKNGPMDVNHAVLAVGYGKNTTSGLDFFTIKNSWGATWGNKGFFDIRRGVNMCGIGVCNSYPMNVREVKHNAVEFLLQDQ